MPINVFGNSNSIDNVIKIDTSFFVQKPYLRSNYIESNIEDIDSQNKFRIKNLSDPSGIREPASKDYVDNNFNDPSINKSTAHIDLNDKIITNARYIQVIQLPQIDSHLAAKLYVDNAKDETSLVRNNKGNDFGNYTLTNINSFTLNNQAEKEKEVITKAYLDQFHQENERSRQDLRINFYDESSDLVRNNQDNYFNDNKLTNIDSTTINRNPNLDNEVANNNYIEDQLDRNTFLGLNQTFENYLKESAGNDTYNLTKYIKVQLTDVTEIKFLKIGSNLLQKRNIKYNNKHNDSRVGDFRKSTKTNSPTGEAGASILPPIGNSFLYIETSGNNSGNDKVFVSWERTHIIQITNITFYYTRFSILTNDPKKSMSRFRIQLLLEDNTSSTQYTVPINIQYSNTSTEWTLLNLNFTVENYGIILVYDQIDTPHANMCFSNIIITHSVH